jgi:membrane fusion protein, copper/silver efflux system
MRRPQIVNALVVVALAVMFVFGVWVGAPASSEKPATAANDTTWTCSMHPQIKLQEPGACPICGMDLIPLEKSEHEHAPTEVAITERAKALAHIRVVPVMRTETTSELRLLGRLEYDETRVRTIAPWVGGRIDRLFVSNLGAKVRAGSAVASVYSPEAWAAQRDLISARRQLERLDDALPLAQRAAKQAVDAAGMRLKLLGVGPKSIRKSASRNVAVIAAFSGTVIEQLVHEGSYVKEGQALYRIADLSKLWAQLDAYEGDLSRIQLGQEVSLEISSLPGETFLGNVAFIDPIVDPMTRTAQIRVEVDNADGRLSRGMFADALIHAERGAGAPLTIPRSAPLFTGTRSLVYVEVPKRDRPTYAAREVHLGPLSGNVYPVLDGLSADERVVVSGAFVLDSDLQIRGGRSMMAMPDDAVRRARAPIEVDDAFMAGLAPVIAAYLALQETLSGDDLPGAKKRFTELATATRAFAPKRPRQARQAYIALAARLGAEAQQGAASEDIDAARRTFERTSLAIIEALERFGNPLDETLHLSECPMAIDDRAANWVQRAPKVENPFLGSKMYRCGSVEGTVAPSEHLGHEASP